MVKNKSNYKIFERKIILSGYRGSIAHNLHIPREKDHIFGIDDKDFFEIYCYPIEYYLSLEGYYHSDEVKQTIENDEDAVAYELRKTFHLLMSCNPTVLLFLYNKPKHYLHVSQGGKILLKNRELFLAKKRIKEAFAGYANEQLKKIKHGVYKGYMGEKRKKIVNLYGHDTKNAATLLRLLTQGKELLLTGELQVHREADRDFLLDVKRGKYSLDKIQEMAKEGFKEIEKAFEKSKLPDKNDKRKIDELLVYILTTELNL